MTTATEPLTIAVPKGRLLDQTIEFFESCGLRFLFEKRSLVAHEANGLLKLILVKNSDLPVYVKHGIAGMGISGEDTLYESGAEFYHLHTFNFGSTKMCLCSREDYDPSMDQRQLSVATKFTRFARDYFHGQGIPVEIIRLGGSVELAPVLGLAPYIVDLVETGDTLRANKLKVTKTLAEIRVRLICNPAYYKLHYERINAFIARLQGITNPEMPKNE
ncbi:MAG: ATP phosphoribosyltransferase [Spirochaeta sp.]|nr:ATP phosphoribosyltransferase [Spirochaeta sp.]